MPRGYRSAVLAAGLVLLAAVANAQPVGDDPGTQERPTQTETEPERQSKPSTNQAVKDGIASVASSLETEKAKSKAQKEDERRRRDLRAQERMAKWAKWMFFAALASVCLTAVGIALIAGTLHHTRRAADYARDMVDEAKATTDAARAALRETQIANDDSRTNTRLELRAYLSVEPAGVNRLRGRDEGMGHVSVRNVGKLPATHVTVFVFMKVAPRPEAEFPVRPNMMPADRTIQPGASMRQGSVEIFPQAQLRVAGDYVFVWGVVYYRDGYGKPRFTRFCHRYNAEGHIPSPNFYNPAAPEDRRILDKDDARYHETGNEAD